MRPTPFPPPSFGIARATISNSGATSRSSNSICWGSRTGAERLPSLAPTPGSDFADFLLGVPDAASVAFGNADKYFRDSLYDAFFTDDWRISSAFTLNAGVRWEYGSPITELFGRLVNLDVVPGFAALAPVVASHPTGTLTGQRYPDSLIHPDKRAFEPRIAIAWRPLPASSLVIRAGYGVYYDTSVYQTLATQMAQQFPLSKSLTVQNTATNPLTLANGFNASPAPPPIHSASIQTFALATRRTGRPPFNAICPDRCK